ncbi:nuclear transport factor 2 family protein [Pseudonocardia dioxanivorans]|uniref:nuclear transport factor 2 family protein n=1 Tax=Pseudonocardia dioxanivorans TaxID=240495 RepID=UPI000CD22052|nr:DUF4440 domain-containing protein [Pseudonocardia dioxanivorans]
MPEENDPAGNDIVRSELVAREPLFHRPEWGTGRADLEAMTAPDYWEVGASGRTYDREFVIGVLLERYARDEPDPWSADGFACRALGPDTYLVTYTLTQGERVTRRATVWERTSGGWRALYHQGTVVAP